MLLNLHVKNLALVEEAEVDFTPGLNIMTGETGAGKSIIIGSIGLALGDRLPKEMLREQAPYALVELVFAVGEQEKAALEAMEIYPEEDCVILSRKMTGSRSTFKINGETMPLSKVKEAAALLIDIHGQHEHQSLLVRKNHLNILDEFAKQDLLNEKSKLKEYYEDYRKLQKEWEHVNLDQSERAREVALLEYEVNEIEEAALTVGEDEQLESDYRRLSHGQKIMESVNRAYEQTGGYASATEQIAGALKELASVSGYDEAVGALEGQLLEIDSLMNDFNRELAEYIADTQFDEQVYYETEQRLDLVNRLKAKYGADIAQILASAEEKRQRLEQLADYDSYLENLQKNLKQKEARLKEQCEKVSAIRQKAAQKLTAAIREQLLDLNFLDVSFSMDFHILPHYTANGYDDAEFMISTNPGEPLRSLEKIASGGELSRIMLAIKTVLADTDAIGTLIFDEIDTGISGRTAQKVSEKMHHLAGSHQIICITHLPQIAAMADSHYLIAKSVENQMTVSTIRQLDREESVGELARMLGGVRITDTVLQSAREMKELAAHTKKTSGEPE